MYTLFLKGKYFMLNIQFIQRTFNLFKAIGGHMSENFKRVWM